MKFFFIYNKIKDKNPHFDFNFKKFYQRWDIAMEFITYIINFKIMTKLE